MPKDITPYGTHHAPPAPRQAAYGDVRDQFAGSSEMVAETRRYALHARTRELDVALAKIAILEYTVKVLETEPLRVAYERLTATGAQLVFVGEIVRGDTPRIQASGELLSVLETLAARYAVFERQVVELKTETKTKAS